jgi:hypothetical protein
MMPTEIVGGPPSACAGSERLLVEINQLENEGHVSACWRTTMIKAMVAFAPSISATGRRLTRYIVALRRRRSVWCELGADNRLDEGVLVAALLRGSATPNLRRHTHYEHNLLLRDGPWPHLSMTPFRGVPVTTAKIAQKVEKPMDTIRAGSGRSRNVWNEARELVVLLESKTTNSHTGIRNPAV